MPRQPVQFQRWQIGIAFAFVTVAFTIQGAFLLNLINDVNHDRLVSCRRTYEGVRAVFTPFFRPVKARTAKERHDIAKFNRIVERLKARCDKQITTKGTP